VKDIAQPKLKEMGEKLLSGRDFSNICRTMSETAEAAVKDKSLPRAQQIILSENLQAEFAKFIEDLLVSGKMTGKIYDEVSLMSMHSLHLSPPAPARSLTDMKNVLAHAGFGKATSPAAALRAWKPLDQILVRAFFKAHLRHYELWPRPP
jgi:hypothetical protein